MIKHTSKNSETEVIDITGFIQGYWSAMSYTHRKSEVRVCHAVDGIKIKLTTQVTDPSTRKTETIEEQYCACCWDRNWCNPE